ncbi:hypothetical protein F2P79_009356 [Pimephales promelas]|nr:hypothetical protein F2P79_009356 [Pimephales promelas]
MLSISCSSVVGCPNAERGFGLSLWQPHLPMAGRNKGDGEGQTQFTADLPKTFLRFISGFHPLPNSLFAVEQTDTLRKIVKKGGIKEKVQGFYHNCSLWKCRI